MNISPEEWQVILSLRNATASIMHDGELIAEVEGAGYAAFPGKRWDECHCNARIISAAPSMRAIIELLDAGELDFALFAIDRLLKFFERGSDPDYGFEITAGEWSYGPDNERPGRYMVSSSEQVIAVNIASESNAQLIAAIPEMYSQLLSEKLCLRVSAMRPV